MNKLNELREKLSEDLRYDLDEAIAELLDRVDIYLPENSRGDIYNEAGIILPENADENAIS